MLYSQTLLRTIAWNGNLSDSSEVLFQRGRGGARIYRSFCWEKKKPKTCKLDIQRLLLITKNRHLKLITSVLFCVQEDARVWAEWNYSFDMHLTCLGPVSCFSPSWIPSRCTMVRAASVADGFMAATSIVCWNGRWSSLSTLPPFGHKFNRRLGGSSWPILSHSAKKAYSQIRWRFSW